MSSFVEGAPNAGPCTAWVDAEAVAACIGVDVDSVTQQRLEDAAAAASQVLFQLSGRQWNGICSQTVRPCVANSCGWQWLTSPASPGVPQTPAFSWGNWPGFGWGWGWGGEEGNACGCGALSRALLSGYPVVQIDEVLIGPDVLPQFDPDDGHMNWRLDDWRYLTRMAYADGQSAFWPACQRLDVPEGQPGTWAVTYRFGNAPPLPGELAAGQLAGEIYRFCSGGECKLPKGTVQATRQGLTVQMAPFLAWGMKDGQWATGIGLVDMFLGAFNPAGMQRPASVWSPDLDPYPARLGTGSGS